MRANYVAILIVGIYIICLGVITSILQRSVRTANTFTSGTTGHTGVPAVLVGLMLMSEFIGTSASVGTAQEAYKVGISASWNILALAAGFVFYGFFLAEKYKSSGHNTISAILDQVYGRNTKLATSLVMVFALEIVAVAIYAGGGTILSVLLGVDRTSSIIVCGFVSVLYVFAGGMKSVVYTNVVHSIIKYLGIVVALSFGISRVVGFQELHARLPTELFSWTYVGWDQIFA
jgi:solute:Na+ symporter, SSS family